MPVPFYKNDGQGRDSYVTGQVKAPATFFPNSVAIHQNRHREAPNNAPLSPYEKRGDHGPRVLPGLTPTSKDVTKSRNTQSLQRSPSPASLNNSQKVAWFSPQQCHNRGTPSPTNSALNPNPGRSSPNSFSNFFMESTTHKAQRQARCFDLDSVPPNTEVLPGIRTRIRPGVNQYS